MKLVLMAGGKGERLLPLTKDIPKPMVKVAGKTMIEHAIDWAKSCGITDIIITTGYMSEKIEGFFGNGSKFGVSISYFVEKEPLGTGGALAFIGNMIDDDFFLLNSDCICKVNGKKMMDFHKNSKADATILVHTSSHPHDSDLIEYDGSGKAVKFWLKPHSEAPTDKSVAGLYILSPKMLQYVPKEKFSLERQLLPLIHGKGNRVFCYDCNEFIMDAGTFERLKKVEELLKK